MAKQADEVEELYAKKAWTGYLTVHLPKSCWYKATMGPDKKQRQRQILLRSLLHQWRGLARLLHDAAGFYRMRGEAVAYLHQRGVRSPELIEHLRIGYAPGGCLRAWLMQLGYPLAALHQAGLVTTAGYDAFTHRIVFPLEGKSGQVVFIARPHTGY